MTVKPTTGFTLIDDTRGEEWDYDSEPQLKTVTLLYARSHPRSSLSVRINGRTHVVRPIR